MLYIDPKTNEEFDIKVTEVFKKRVRLFVQQVLGLSKVPNNADLKKIFGSYDLRKPMAWLAIFSRTEDLAIAQEKIPQEVFYADVCSKAAELGLVIGNVDFVGSVTINIHKADSKGIVRWIGAISLHGETVKIVANKKATPKQVANIGHGLHILAGVFAKVA